MSNKALWKTIKWVLLQIVKFILIILGVGCGSVLIATIVEQNKKVVEYIAYGIETIIGIVVVGYILKLLIEEIKDKYIFYKHEQFNEYESEEEVNE